MAAVRAKLLVGQLAAFSALGWLVAAVLDMVGIFRLLDALVVAGLLLGVVTGLVAFQGVDRPLIRPTSPILNFPLTDRVTAGVTPSGTRALAVVSACVAAAGLIAAGIVLG